MFKVGDKVRVVGNGSGYIHHFLRMDTIAKVVGVHEDGDLELFGLDCEDERNIYQTVAHEDVLGLNQEPKPTNLKSTDDVIISGVTFEQAIKDDILLMAHLYHKGLSFRDVAKLTNVHERTVRRRFKRYGIPSRAPKGVK